MASESASASTNDVDEIAEINEQLRSNPELFSAAAAAYPNFTFSVASDSSDDDEYFNVDGDGDDDGDGDGDGGDDDDDDDDDESVESFESVIEMPSSFLPNFALINALKCCGNPACRKEAAPFTLKMCTACRSLSYCNVDCQKKHRKNHKHECNEIATYIKEWLLANDHNDDVDDDNGNDDDDGDALFQPIPPQDDCPICSLPLPIKNEEKRNFGCCGNSICQGCCDENIRVSDERGMDPCCAFCREPNTWNDEEFIIRVKKRMEKNDSAAIFNASDYYSSGKYGLPQDPQKAFELCLRAADLGNSRACGNVAFYYNEGVGVPKDMVKAREYSKKAVKGGDIYARFNMGVDEQEKCNHRLACRHWLVSTAAGNTESLKAISNAYKFKLVTKKEYATALDSYVNVHKDEWSIEREAALLKVSKSVKRQE